MVLLKGSGERRRVSNREKRVFWPSTTTSGASSGATIKVLYFRWCQDFLSALKRCRRD